MKNTQKKTGFFAAVRTLMLVMFFTFTGANSLMAAEKAMTKEQTEARVMAIKDRVAEIKAMDLKTLSKTERSNMRHELKDMKKELNQYGPTYVYISGAGLILIIILLILLL